MEKQLCQWKSACKDFLRGEKGIAVRGMLNYQRVYDKIILIYMMEQAAAAGRLRWFDMPKEAANQFKRVRDHLLLMQLKESQMP